MLLSNVKDLISKNNDIVIVNTFQNFRSLKEHIITTASLATNKYTADKCSVAIKCKIKHTVHIRTT